MKSTLYLVFSLVTAATLEKRQLLPNIFGNPSSSSVIEPSSSPTSSVISSSIPSRESTLSSSARASSIVLTSSRPLPTATSALVPSSTGQSTLTSQSASADPPAATNNGPNMAMVLGALAGVLLVSAIGIYAIRKTTLKPSKNFKDRMNPEKSDYPSRNASTDHLNAPSQVGSNIYAHKPVEFASYETTTGVSQPTQAYYDQSYLNYDPRYDQGYYDPNQYYYDQQYYDGQAGTMRSGASSNASKQPR